MVPRFWRLAEKIKVPVIFGRNTRRTPTGPRPTLTRPPQPQPQPQPQQPSSSSLRPSSASLAYLSPFTPSSTVQQPRLSFFRPSSSAASMAYPLSSTTQQPPSPPTGKLPPLISSCIQEIMSSINSSSLFPQSSSSPNSTNSNNSNNTMNDEDAELFLREDFSEEAVRLLREAQSAFRSFRSACESSGEDRTPNWDLTSWLQTLTAMILAFDALKSHGLVVAQTIRETYLRYCGIKDEIPPHDQAPEPKPPGPQGEAKTEPAQPGSSEPEFKPAEPKPPKPKPPEPDSKAAEPEPPKPKPPEPDSKAAEPKPPKPQPQPAEKQPEPQSQSEPAAAEPEEEHSPISFSKLLKSPNRIKYVFLLFGVTEEDDVVAEINRKGKLSVKASVRSGPDMENTTATLSLPPGEWCLSRTSISVKNGVFLVELKGSQINNPSSS